MLNDPRNGCTMILIPNTVEIKKYLKSISIESIYKVKNYRLNLLNSISKNDSNVIWCKVIIEECNKEIRVRKLLQLKDKNNAANAC